MCPISQSKLKVWIMNAADMAAGKLAVRVLKGLKGLPDHGPDLQPIVAEALDTAGFTVEQEVWVGEYWPGQRGRVNLMAFHKGGKVAIELDRRNVRRRSAAKLRSLDLYRIAAVRGPVCDRPWGVHEVVGLKVSA